jgi:hypothetical protein
MPDPITAGVSGLAGIGSAVANIFGAQSAAQAQQAAAQQANQTILQQQQQGLQAQSGYFNQGTAPLASIAGQGAQAYSNLNAAIPGLTAPITMDQATLEKTPGYQFNLLQGERGISLGAAAAGLSGAQAKSAAQFATGLADSTYQNQFNNANTNKQNAYNFLLGTAQTGVGAAGQYGTDATYAGAADVANSQQVGANLSSNLTNAGQAQAGANIATGQQVGKAIGAASTLAPSANPFGNYGMYGATSDPTKIGSLY